MADFPQPVLDDIQRGKAFLSELDAEDSANMELGCVNCCVTNYECISSIMNSLEMKVSLDEYDDDAIKLYGKMLIIIGDYTIKVPPTVDAGANKSVPINETAIFNATITPGSAAITNIQWTIVSGSGTLTNANTANVSVDDFIEGNTVLKVVVTDANGRTGSDTVTLTGTAVVETIKVYYRFQDTNVLPNEATVLASAFVDVIPNSDYIVPVNTDEVKYVLVFEQVSEQYKARWVDTIDSDNNGLIDTGNTFQITSTIGQFRGYITSFKTQFNNPIQFIKAEGGPPG